MWDWLGREGGKGVWTVGVVMKDMKSEEKKRTTASLLSVSNRGRGLLTATWSPDQRALCKTSVLLTLPKYSHDALDAPNLGLMMWSVDAETDSKGWCPRPLDGIRDVSSAYICRSDQLRLPVDSIMITG